MSKYSTQDLVIALNQGAHVIVNTWWARFVYKVEDGQAYYKIHESEWEPVTSSYNINNVLPNEDCEIDYEPAVHKQVKEFLK